MTTAEKLTQIADNQERVFYAGYDASTKDAYDKFWDAYQQNGNRLNNSYAFCHSYWNDTIYNPKYPITTNTTSLNATYMFYRSGITDTKVDITINATNSTGVFYMASSLVTIRKLIVADGVAFTEWFTSCTALKNLTMAGVISKNISFADCSKLTNESVQTVIDCLKDLSGGTAQKLTLHATVGAKLTDTQKTAISAKNWTLVY